MDIFIKNYNRTTNQKVQAIDGFGKYLSNTNDIKEALVMPVVKGKGLEESQLKIVADQIRFNMLHEAHYNNGKIDVVGKSKYYPQGSWDIKVNSVGKYFEVLELDIHGEDADILIEGYLEKRLSNYFNMVHEYNLLKTLRSLGYNVRLASENEDKKKKVDLILTNNKGEWIGIHVYKSNNSTALCKLDSTNIDQFISRYGYNVLEYGSALNKDNVKKWIKDVRSGKNKILYNEKIDQWIKL